MGIWDTARGLASESVSGWGDILGLPEWNISEWIAPSVKASTPTTSSTGWPQAGPTSSMNYTPVPTSTYQSTSQPTGDVKGVEAPTSPGPTQQTTGESTYTPYVPSYEESKAAIEPIYAPIFAELDRRIGITPETEASLRGEVESLEEWQRGEATRGREAGEAELEGFKTEEGEKSVRTLAEFSTDAANLLRKIGGIYGGSSGAEAVGAAVGKEVTRTRGMLLEKRDAAVRTINMKIADVGREFESQSAAIDKWKATKLTEVTGYIKELVDNLNAQKTTASTEMASQITQRITDLQLNAENYLMELDRMYKTNKLDLENWRTEREGNLQDFIARLKATGEYQGSTYETPTAPTLAEGGKSTISETSPTFGSYMTPKEGEPDLWSKT